MVDPRAEIALLRQEVAKLRDEQAALREYVEGLSEGLADVLVEMQRQRPDIWDARIIPAWHWAHDLYERKQHNDCMDAPDTSTDRLLALHRLFLAIVHARAPSEG